MIVNFTKMHGLGNDFVVIDLITQGARLQKSHIKHIADRKFGIGCDQVILITPPTKADVDFFYKIFNADGQEVEQCGNGVRCAARFFIDNGLSNKTQLVVDCQGGTANLKIEDNQNVSVNLGKNFTPVVSKELNYPKLPTIIHTVSVGNPHGVCIVDDLASTQVKEWGKLLTKDPMFPEGANIGFMQILARDRVQLRVYERGVGLTHACGSGACAAMLVGKALNLLDNKVHVMFEFGELLITYDAQDQSLHMSGPANSVFIGRFKV
jgi:diaminopimelate epimerase